MHVLCLSPGPLIRYKLDLFQAKSMAYKDKRMKVLNEILSGIKVTDCVTDYEAS